MKALTVPAIMPALGVDRCPKDQSRMKVKIVEHCIQFECVSCGYHCTETNAEMRVQFELARMRRTV